MRNGNFLPLRWDRACLTFLPYLWGMETEKCRPKSSIDRKFLPYLWGMETEMVLYSLMRLISVLTVPMRNGNPCCEMIVLRSSSGSYRTYEEWKHSALIGVTVLNVWFLPYLWGMETSILFQMDHQSQVLTVPMRNGNEFLRGVRLPVLRVLTVPMRNGNKGGVQNEVRNIKVLTVPMRNGNRYQLQMPTIVGKFLPYLW